MTKGTRYTPIVFVKEFAWDSAKNEKLILERDISFEIVLSYIEKQDVLDIIEHPNSLKYPNQKIYVLEIADYIYLVPFVETENEIFLKTIIPSRKAKKNYQKEK